MAKVDSAGGSLKTAIQSERTRINSTLTQGQIVARAKALSCAGCHQLGNGVNLGGGLTWPNSLGFTHISESKELGPEGERFRISQALVDVFLLEWDSLCVTPSAARGATAPGCLGRCRPPPPRLSST